MNNEPDHYNWNWIVCVIGCVFDQTLALVLYRILLEYINLLYYLQFIYMLFFINSLINNSCLSRVNELCWNEQEYNMFITSELGYVYDWLHKYRNWPVSIEFLII